MLVDRIGNFEALMATRLDQQVAQVDARFDALSAQIAAVKRAATLSDGVADLRA